MNYWKGGSLALVVLLLWVGIGAPSFALATLDAASPPVDSLTEVEKFHYTWKLSKFLGWIAGLFLPNRGEGTLTFEPLGGQRMRGELMITSEDSESGEFWGYETEMDLESGHTVRAGSSYFYDGKRRDRRSEIGDEGVFDIASTIYWLRRELPQRPRRIEVWSDGKIYPVVVQPRGSSKRKVGKTKILARRYMIEGAPGGEPRWKGKLELWLAADERATPVEIVVHRGPVAVRLRITP